MKKEKVKGKKERGPAADSAVAVDRRATGSVSDAPANEAADPTEPRARRSRATPERVRKNRRGDDSLSVVAAAGPAPVVANATISDPATQSPQTKKPDPRRSGRTQSEAMKAYHADVKAGRRSPPEPRPPRRDPRRNPLFDLPEKDRSQIFVWLRECPYTDAVQQMLRERGLGEVARAQIDEFFEREAHNHWEVRIQRAATEADALVELVEACPVKFSAGILAALGQEAFRQVSSGAVAPESMGRIATLFLRARADERSDQMQELKREKLSREIAGQLEQAFEKLADEVERHPEARDAFEALRRELAQHAEES